MKDCAKFTVESLACKQNNADGSEHVVVDRSTVQEENLVSGKFLLTAKKVLER
jgi:hypothetical protein